MSRPPPSSALTDLELQELDELLQAVPAPLQALEWSAVDGFLVGVLLQPRRVPESRWMPWVTDEQGRALPPNWPQAGRLQDLVRRRHAELDGLIECRSWFDPWVVQGDEDTVPRLVVQAWVLGWATACSVFPELTEGPQAQDHPELTEALAQIYQHLDPEDLEDAEALLAEIETLEPPVTLDEAVESLVRGTLLLADVSRPLRTAPERQPAPGRRPGGSRPSGSRSSGGRPSGGRTRRS